MSDAMDEARRRIIVALDVNDLGAADALAARLAGRVGAFKVGLELLTAAGSRAVVDTLGRHGLRIFYDAKFSDIPNTVAGASRAAADLGVWMFNVHASCGEASMRAAAEAKGSSIAIAVTVLTSLDDDGCQAVFRGAPLERVLDFARDARNAGLDGIVCSPRELDALRADAELSHLLTVVPGIRPSWAAKGDQSRITTPGDAIRKGASYLVIGRPITQPPSDIADAEAAADCIAEEIAVVLEETAG